MFTEKQVVKWGSEVDPRAGSRMFEMLFRNLVLLVLDSSVINTHFV